jgi:hypothetical protein
MLTLRHEKENKDELVQNNIVTFVNNSLSLPCVYILIS